MRSTPAAAKSCWSLTMPVLIMVGDNFEPGDDIGVGDNPVLTSFSLPALTTVTGDIRIGPLNDALTSFSIPLLTTVRAFLVGSIGNDALTGFSVPLLTTVADDFSVVGNDVLTSFSVPMLATVGADFAAAGNLSLTSFSVPMLATVGGNFAVAGNAALNSCLVQAILDQLIDFMEPPRSPATTAQAPAPERCRAEADLARHCACSEHAFGAGTLPCDGYVATSSPSPPGGRGVAVGPP
jgi:hypothetical protein